MPRYVLLLLAAWLPALAAQAQQSYALRSPDGQLTYALRLTPQAPVYDLTFHGRPVVQESPLGLVFEDGGAWGAGLRVAAARTTATDETYALPVGKASRVRNHYRQLTLDLRERTGGNRLVQLVVRAYDDGLAFRYEFPAQPGRASLVLTDEQSTFRLVGDPQLVTLLRESYTTSHEGHYSHLPLSALPADTLLDLPTLACYPGGPYVGITEANLRDYASLYLARHAGVLTSRLSPLPGQGRVKAQLALPHSSPWRVLLLGEQPGRLLESNIITSLCAPPSGDFSWVQPGLSDFHWWNGDVLPDTTFAPGRNFEFNQYYIDFCARHHLAYHTVIGYGNAAWYQNDGEGYAPGPHTDVTRPVPGLNMQQLGNYARRKGVGLRVWVHWQPFYAQLDTALVVFEKWGVRGMMVDFMDRDDQQMVRMQEEMLQKAARHHIHIQFHGAAKPTGLARTYPNELTREGTLNYENNKWGPGMTAEHDLDMPFTRLLAGPTDYHLGGFRAVLPTGFRVQYTRPLMLGTRCHMLAMYVVLESYLGMVCDYPAAYEHQPGLELLEALPTTWDQTRVPLAEVGRYVCVARRHGRTWYVGAIGTSQPQALALPLAFLPPGQYQLASYTDAPDQARDPNRVQRELRPVTRRDTVALPLASGGGAVLVLTPLK